MDTYPVPRPALQVLILLVSMLVAGCRTYRERDVQGWQRIQDQLKAAEQDGLSDAEAEDVVQHIVADAELCEDAGPRLGRFTLALQITQEMTDRQAAAALRERFLPEAIHLGLSNHAYARLLLLYLGHINQEAAEDAEAELVDLDRYAARLVAATDVDTRNLARLHRTKLRTRAARFVDEVLERRWLDEVARLLAEAKADGLLDGDEEVARSFQDYGAMASSGAPRLGRAAWMPRDGDTGWWRRAGGSTTVATLVCFTSQNCGHCPAFWRELMQRLQECEAGSAVRLVAVVAGDELPDYVAQPGGWGVYRDRDAAISWFYCWGVSAVPTAFLLDAEGRFTRVFLSRDELSPAIAAAAAAAM